jgi:hypothetical protein
MFTAMLATYAMCAESLETFQQGIDDATARCSRNVCNLAWTNRISRQCKSEAQEHADAHSKRAISCHNALLIQIPIIEHVNMPVIEEKEFTFHTKNVTSRSL